MCNKDIKEKSNELIKFLDTKPKISKALKKLEEFIHETRHPYQFCKKSPSKIKLKSVFNVFKAVHHYVQNEKDKKNIVKFMNTKKMKTLIRKHLFSLFWMIGDGNILIERRRLYEDIKKYYKNDIFKVSKLAEIERVPEIVEIQGKDSKLVIEIIEFEREVLGLQTTKMKGPIQYWKESLTFKQKIDQGLKSIEKIFKKKKPKKLKF